MKLRPFFSCLVLAWASVSVGAGLALGASAAKSTKDDYQSTYEEARKIFLSRQYVRGEQTLLRSLTSKTNTEAWHAEAAQRLVTMAYTLTSQASADVTQSVARLALAHLQQQQQQSNNGRHNAAAQLQAGLIYEKLLGDWSSAKASYQAAKANNPAAAAHLQDLQARESQLSGKGHK